MKLTRYKYSKVAGGLALAVSASTALTGCIEDTMPTDGAIGEQVQQAGQEALSRAVTAYMTMVTSYSSSSDPSDIGFPSFQIWRETMTPDLAPVSTVYDYYNWYYVQSWLGDYAIHSLWQRHYGLAHAANLLLQGADYDNPAEARFIGNALSHRAMAYMDLMRYYEYRPTGVASLDAQAEANGIYGLTVPIVGEYMTEKEGRNNPRAPFYTMWRFVMHDLDRAERLMDNYRTPAALNESSLPAVCGQKARLWLEIASRLDQFPDDLATMLAHDNDADIPYPSLGITTAREAYEKAAAYATKVINGFGFQPLSYSQWYDTRNGFNSVNNAWIWAVMIGANDDCAYLDWQSWVSYLSPECDWGIGNPTYNAMRMIDAHLFSTISTDDWRRDTWIAPGDVADREAYEQTYAKATSFSYAEFSKCAAYVGFKFHPAGGERTNSQVGNAVDIPLMRVEEMYFIKAEAEASSLGVEVGRQTLEAFMNQYRWRGKSPYVNRSATLKDFVYELMDLKRVEFWGEGVTPWDFKRLNRAVQRNYSGTNHSADGAVVNSYEGYCAPWMNLYISDSEKNLDEAIKLNPDPSNAIR